MKKLQMQKTLTAAALTALVALNPAVSMAHDYTYLEGGWLHRHEGGRDELGGRLAGSVSVLPQLALIGEAAFTDELDQYSAGALVHHPINATIDWMAGATLEHARTNRGDDTGVGARGGFRVRMDEDRLELIPELRVARLANTTTVSARAGASYEVAPRLDVLGTAQLGDEDRAEAGLRYRFGR